MSRLYELNRDKRKSYKFRGIGIVDTINLDSFDKRKTFLEMLVTTLKINKNVQFDHNAR